MGVLDRLDGVVMMEDSDSESLRAGVTVGWLMKAFRLSRATVNRRLVGLQPVAMSDNGAYLYDLPDAAARLVVERVDLDHILKNIKPENLPDRLRESYWNAKLKEQRFEEKAGRLWATESVVSMFSTVLKEIREIMQILPDNIGSRLALDPKGVQAVTEIVDGVQDAVYQHILNLDTFTPNQLGDEKGEEDTRQTNRDYGDFV